MKALVILDFFLGLTFQCSFDSLMDLDKESRVRFVLEPSVNRIHLS